MFKQILKKVYGFFFDAKHKKQEKVVIEAMKTGLTTVLDIMDETKLGFGTVYVTLHRLETTKVVYYKWGEVKDSLGNRRKYYYLKEE